MCYKLVLVLALGLPQFILAQNITEKTTSNNTDTSCKTKEFKDASDEVFACFSANVNHSANSTIPGCKTLSGTYKNFVSVANASCYNDTRARNLPAAVSFLNYSTNSVKDFAANGGFECIRSAKGLISNCLSTNILVKENNPKYTYEEEIAKMPEVFWKMSRLTIESGNCMEARKIKKCVTGAVRSKCDGSKTHTINVYIRSLFEFMLENCPDVNGPRIESIEMKKLDEQMLKIGKQMRTSIGLLGALLALAILTFFYICGRKCSVPAMKSGIKGVNERFSMSVTRRRKSLVNEEVAQHQA